MTDTVMLEASLFELKKAAAAVDDPMFKSQLQLTLSVLSNAVAAASESLTSATVNDVEFALNDVAGTAGELNAADAEAMNAALDAMKADVAALKEATALPPDVVAAAEALRSKLKVRKSAIERQTYRAEGAAEEPLPHPPEELKKEAMVLRERLAAAGFSTPELDKLIDDPSSLRFATIGHIVDELEVILG